MLKRVLVLVVALLMAMPVGSGAWAQTAPAGGRAAVAPEMILPVPQPPAETPREMPVGKAVAVVAGALIGGVMGRQNEMLAALGLIVGVILGSTAYSWADYISGAVSPRT
jgi:hypothetical protein